jgi:transcriptional regulator with XRE-family HTH domain
MNIGELLKNWRETKKINIRKMAKKIGISISILSRVENGEKVGSGTLIKLIDWIFSKP